MVRLVAAGLLAAAVLGCPQAAAQTSRSRLLIEQGRQLFFNETFNGNGRTCGTCHPATNNFTLDPAFIATLPLTDPLFVAEFDPELAGLENPALMRSQALILENLDGFDRPGVMRGIPHILALPLSDVTDADGDADQLFPDGTRPVNALGWSADGAPGDGSLRAFATGAVVQHFTRRLARVEGIDFRLPTETELDALAAFQASLGRQAEVNTAALAFIDDRANRGRDLFNGIGTNRACSACHDNAGANNVDDAGNAFNDNFDTGVRQLPVGPPDGGFGQDAVAGIPGFGNGTFNTPPLIESADSPPFFHDNSVATLEGAVAFYTGATFAASPSGQAGGGAFALDATGIAEVAVFLRALNALENARTAAVVALNARRATSEALTVFNLLRAESDVEDGTGVLLAAGLAPPAVEAFVDADELLDQAITTPAPATRIRLIDQARAVLRRGARINP